MSYRPKGETTHYILRVASAPSPTAVTDSLDFQVAGAPLQIQFASAKCVRCAPLRSGGRRLAVRKMIECHIPAQTRTPFPASRDFPSRGNEGHGEKNGRVIYFMYHSGVSPFGGWRHHLSAPLGSVSLDSQSPTAPCESSSLATASGGTIKLRYAVSCL